MRTRNPEFCKWRYILVVIALLFASTTAALAQHEQSGTQQFKPGDTVEIDDTGMGAWERGTVVPYKPNDRQDGNTYRVVKEKFHSLDDPAGEISQTIHMRPAAPKAAAPAANTSTPSASVRTGTISPVYRPGAPLIRTTTPAASVPQRAATLAPATPTKTAARVTPRMAGAFPSLPGTGWDLLSMQKKGDTASKPTGFAQSFSFCKTGSWSITRYGLAAGQMGTWKVQGNKLIMINSLNNETFGNFSMSWNAGDSILQLDDGKWIWTLQLVSLNACGEG